MVQIKGSAIQETIKQILRRAGEDALNKILATLDEEARTVFKAKIFASTWYPLDVFTRFLELEIKILAAGDENMVTRGSEAVIERQLRGIYKVFVKLGSPEFVIKQSPPFMLLISKVCPSKWICPPLVPLTSATGDLKNSTASSALPSSDFTGKPSRFPAPRT